MGTVGAEGIWAAYELLGPGGPHQSICDGNTECVVDPIERSSATLGLLCGKEGALVKLLKDLETEKMGMVWFTDIGGGRISSGPGRYGVNKSGLSFLLLLHWWGHLNI